MFPQIEGPEYSRMLAGACSYQEVARPYSLAASSSMQCPVISDFHASIYVFLPCTWDESLQ